MRRPILTTLLCSALLVGVVSAEGILDIHGSSEKARAAAWQFLAENAKKEGVTSLLSGLQYKVIESGSGIKPRLGDRVAVEYRGTLIDGSEFENSYRGGAPEMFWLEDAIPGFREALRLMEEGAHWEVYIPAELAEGKEVARAGHVLVYDVHLISVIPGEDVSDTSSERATEESAGEAAPVAFAYLGQRAASGAAEMYPRRKRVGPDEDYAFLEDNAARGGVIVLPSSLQYKILKPGSGGSPRPDDTVELDYLGRQPGRREFAGSYGHATPTRVRVAQLVPAWRTALLRMEDGARWEFYVPPSWVFPRSCSSEWLERRKVSW